MLRLGDTRKKSKFENLLGEKLKTIESSDFLKTQRLQTDNSLDCERGKADESLLVLQRQTEVETDRKIAQDRLKADKAKNQSRVEADKDHALDRQAAAEEGMGETRSNQLESDKRLLVQRSNDDKIISGERSRIDHALQKERETKDAAALELLGKERGETDQNLGRERQETDSGFLRSSMRFVEEQSLHSSTKAALTTRDEFLAIVSHDLRNPIGASLSFAELLLEDPDFAQMRPEIVSWIEIIKRNSEMSLRLINDLLDMERLAIGQFDLNLRALCLDDTVQTLVLSFAPQAAAKKVEIKVIRSGFSGKVTADQDRIKQVLSNLLGNALKFTPEYGQITLRVEQDENNSQVSVSDTGPGIPDSEKERIFERFTQIKDKDRRGLGLGLYIAKLLIEAHRGRLFVESDSGKGSTFRFVIPTNEAK